MPVSIEELRPHLQAFDFPRLFVEGLGWDHYHTEPFVVQVNERDYTLNPIAEKAGFAVYECDSSVDHNVPQYPVRRKIESEVAKRTYEHLIIFTDPGRKAQVWQWVKRESGKPAACREYAVTTGASGDHLLQRLQPLFVSLDEEPSVNIALVASRVRAALDVEKVTKRFYERFRSELTAFGKFIEGITAQGDRDWYASLMLNRMMFVYFVQKQGFLDEDIDYLRNRLKMVQEQSGGGRFQQFYRLFLLRLFHEGLGQPEAQRAPDLAALLGKVPFLNGGLFDVHDLERDNPDISIPDAARKECPVAFGPDGGVWRLLRDDPDRYIYPAVGHGIAWNARQPEAPKSLEKPFNLPDHIAAGIDDVSKRGGWNAPAPDDFALPTETWREVVARRQRYDEVKDKLQAGEVQGINNLITLNLDIERFARDVIAQSEGPELLRAFWHALYGNQERSDTGISVLDPTCGSGAFLFAALNILEPLYTACLEGMRGFLDDVERSERERSPEHLGDFRRILEQVDKHPSERYFILKSIVLNNLYGVDIMEEAVEICKLRLFLKLVAQLESYDQIEPLPDIDFNVRAGNTLVGFTSLDAVQQAMTITPNGQRRQVFPEDQAALDRINEEAEIASAAFNQFRWQQTMLGGEVTSADKQALRDRLSRLDDELDHLLAREYGVNPKRATAYDAWRASHQPFHWFVEFYGVMTKGGFDVVIGNPPYVRHKDVATQYAIRGFQTKSCGDLYAFCTERGLSLLCLRGRIGLIVPISMFGTDGFKPLQELSLDLLDATWISCYSNRPSQLFDGAQKRLSIILGYRFNGQSSTIFSSRYLRWRREEFDFLFDSRISYASAHEAFRVFDTSLEKLGSELEVNAFNRLVQEGRKLSEAVTQEDRFKVFYTRKFGYFLAFLDSVPQIINAETGRTVPPSELKTLPLYSAGSVKAAVSVLSSSTFFWFWNVLSDCRNLNRRDLLAFPFNPEGISPSFKRTLASLGERYLRELEQTSRTMLKSGLRIETFDYAACKFIIDEIDRVLATHYGFTDEELDFIINYDIKYRMGREG